MRVNALASATANTRAHGAPFRHVLFYGPPGTGKTMAAKQLAAQVGGRRGRAAASPENAGSPAACNFAKSASSLVRTKTVMPGCKRST